MPVTADDLEVVNEETEFFEDNTAQVTYRNTAPAQSDNSNTINASFVFEVDGTIDIGSQGNRQNINGGEKATFTVNETTLTGSQLAIVPTKLYDYDGEQFNLRDTNPFQPVRAGLNYETTCEITGLSESNGSLVAAPGDSFTVGVSVSIADNSGLDEFVRPQDELVLKLTIGQSEFYKQEPIEGGTDTLLFEYDYDVPSNVADGTQYPVEVKIAFVYLNR